MSARFSVLAVATSMLLIGGCSAGQAPTAEPSVAVAPASTAVVSTRPTIGPSAQPSPAAASRKPVASGVIDPASFTNTVDNAWFPLTPGTTFTYRGTKDGKKAVETFSVTSGSKVIDGVTCVVVEDKLALGGVATEKLLGYYAQDQEGNVWYFGEDTEELDAKGQVVSTEGSWHAGIDKAPPAMVMEASPTVGRTFAHDYTKNDFSVLSLSEKVTVPNGAYTDALVTKEWSPIEPDVETHKFYVRGVGMVRDVATKGPTEELLLVKVDHT